MAKTVRTMRPIPKTAAKRIADEYGYDQVMIMARRCGDNPEPNGEHITTHGRTPEHCRVAAILGDRMKEHARWPDATETRKKIAALEKLVADQKGEINNLKIEILERDEDARYV